MSVQDCALQYIEIDLKWYSLDLRICLAGSVRNVRHMHLVMLKHDIPTRRCLAHPDQLVVLNRRKLLSESGIAVV